MNIGIKTAIVVLAATGLFFLAKNLLNPTINNSEIILCDAETVVEGNFIANDRLFNNGHTQSSEKSYSGKYSSFVDAKNKYGIGHTIKNPAKNTRFIASVRRHAQNGNKSAIVITGKPAKNFYKQVSTSKYKDKDGWELLTIDAIIPDSLDISELSIYTYAMSQGGAAYFDDLQIEMIQSEDNGLNELDQLHLYFDNQGFRKINKKREEALNKGILQTGDDDWVKAKLTEDGEVSNDVNVRLKGDWTDHLKGDYWSYRIKMPKDKSWKRMQVFSLQDPATRSFLDEWIYHKALEEVDVITPRYGFVNFSQNNQDPVLYAYEEHFDKQIAEYKNRREGVIVKFTEDYLWNLRLKNKDIHNKDIHQNVIHNADILPFKTGRTIKDPKLLEQFERAQDLMDAYRNRSAPAHEVFDMELMAKYYSITDIFNANHSAIWHNLRFYYNPITRKLEPIGFDGYTEDGHYRMYVKLFFGEFMSSEYEDEWSAFYKYIFRDEEFIRYYVPMMVEYSSDAFINGLLDKYDSDLFNLETLIRRSTKADYEFDSNQLLKRAKLIHKNIMPFSENSLKVFREKDTNGVEKTFVTNYHNLPLEVIGSQKGKKWIPIENEDASIIRSNGRKLAPTFTPIEVASSDKYVFFRLPGTSQVYSSTIKDWRRPETLKIGNSKNVALSIPLPKEAYSIKDSIITFFAGSHSLDRPLLIPEGYTLILEGGVNLDMIKKAYILLYGTLFTTGSPDSPVLITSTDKTAQGITVMKAPQKSILNYTSITNLNTLLENEWQLTGAVTFYESDVEMTQVTIANNLCEDALNIIRSSFSIKELNINNTFADGFDCDFCKGKIFDSYLHHTGNDGLDFSGSYIEVESTRLETIGDKGISAGEEATLIVTDVVIDGSVIGIASKDLSKVKVVRATLKNCQEGFAAYRKKPEFGGGTINVKSFTQEGVTNLTVADPESKINLPK
ncbi:MAG: hypothetical protein P1U56_25805 [Saprospiraceae bacterium]|nr:hypothetical protein [Saprospiraceae bacterium]